MKLPWPRGKYNHERIVGFSVKLRINAALWNWRPFYYSMRQGGPSAGWLCVYVYFSPEYRFTD